MRRVLSLLVLLVAAPGCAGDLGDPAPYEDWRRQPHCLLDLDVEEDIFARRCGSRVCHGAPSADDGRVAGDLDLVSPDVASRLVDVPANKCATEVRVVPNDPDGSLLILKLRGTVPPGCGDPMPQVGARLSEAEIDCVRAWITDVTGPVLAPEADGGAP